MDMENSKKKKSFLLKTWDRCRSIGGRPKSPSKPSNSFTKSKSWHSTTTKSSKIAPEGCFSVYVGEERERFVIRTKYLNHPLFRMLLEDAEMEYGYNSEGPLSLPCDVDLFCHVLAEMGSRDQIEPSCASCSPFNPSRRLGNSDMAKGYGSYSLLTPSRLLKMNHL